jgi:hypothetical protein
MKNHDKIARFFTACLPLLFLVLPVSGQDTSGLADSLNRQAIPVTNITLENNEVLMTVDYDVELREAMDRFEFALPSILKQAASQFPDSSLIRLEVSVGGEKTGVFDIAARDALEGARGRISNDEMMSRLRGKPLVDIARRLGQPARADAPPSSEDFFSKYFPGTPSPAPSSSPEAGRGGSEAGGRRPARLPVLPGILIAGILVLSVGIILVRRHRFSQKNKGAR